MKEAKNGDTVRVHYTGKLDDGSVFDTSYEGEPLEFSIGSGQIIPGFENGVVGLKVGEKKSIRISPEEAYGPRFEELVVAVPKEQFPEDFEPEIGQQLQVSQEDGQIMLVTVTGFDDETITLDANHPLAGKPLNFEIELVEIL